MGRDVAKVNMDGIAGPQVAYRSTDVISGVATHDLVAEHKRCPGRYDDADRKSVLNFPRI